MIWVWDWQPVAFSLGEFDVRWYGLVYALGILLAWWWVPYLFGRAQLVIEKHQQESLLFGAFCAGIVGGRLGYFGFYDLSILWTDPAEMVRLWHGGMSIHGGLIFAAAYVWWFSRRQQLNFWQLSDVFVIPLSFVLIFGRLANWINGELVGVPVNGALWGVVFPHVDLLPRHPSQLYEMASAALIFALVSISFTRGWWKTPGRISALFLLSYGVLRWTVEFWREHQDWLWSLSMGQWLSMAMVLWSVVAWNQFSAVDFATWFKRWNQEYQRERKLVSVWFARQWHDFKSRR